MCLAYQSKKPKRLKSYKQRYGWKVFAIAKEWDPTKTRLYFSVMDKPAKEGVWLTSKRKRPIRDGSENLYIPRFHVYLEYPKYGNSDFHTVRRVLFRGPVATGYQSQFSVVVATKIKILPRGK